MLRTITMINNFPSNLSVERICFLNNKSNQFISIFNHIRNSLAHGRMNMVEHSNKEDRYNRKRS